MDEDKPSHEETQVFASNSLGDVAVAFDGEAVTVQFDVQPPQQPSAVERCGAHEDIQQDAGDIPILSESIGRIERADDIRCAEVEGASPGRLPQSTPGVDFVDVKRGETFRLMIGLHGGTEVEIWYYGLRNKELQSVCDTGFLRAVCFTVGIALGGGEEYEVF